MSSPERGEYKAFFVWNGTVGNIKQFFFFQNVLSLIFYFAFAFLLKRTFENIFFKISTEIVFFWHGRGF